MFEMLTDEDKRLIHLYMTEQDILSIIVSPRVCFYVTKVQSERALKMLKNRIARGEDVYHILDINPSNKYYVDKLLNGLCIFTDTLYFRVMGELPYTPLEFCIRYYGNYSVCRTIRKLVDRFAKYDKLLDTDETKNKIKEANKSRKDNFKSVCRLFKDLGCTLSIGDEAFLKKIYSSMSEIEFLNDTKNLRLYKETLNDYFNRKASEIYGK